MLELTVDRRVPLLVRLEQRSPGIDVHLEFHPRRLGLASDDLHHLVAHIPLAARKLVRSAQHRRRCQRRVREQGHPPPAATTLHVRRHERRGQ